MSPLFSLSSPLTLDQLRKVEAAHDLTGKRYPYDHPKAYFNLLRGRGVPPPAPSLRIAREAGWELSKDTSILNYWQSPQPFVLPAGISLQIAPYFDASAYRLYLRLMRENFRVSRKFMKELDAIMETIEPHVTTVNLLNRHHQPVASGLVATRNHHAFLFCGSVHRRHRGQGLWRVLVAARQMVSAAQGARHWVTTTRNPRIQHKGDRSFEVLVLTK